MAYEQKPNKGTLFKNDRKETDTHPDYKGTANVNGQEYWMSAWINTTTDGKKRLSLSFQKKEAAATKSAVESHSTEDDLSDQIPF